MSQRKFFTMTKDRKRQLYILFYFYLLIALLSLFTVASYTWFSLSRTPRVSDLNMYITTQSGLELSTDPSAAEWELQLDFRDIVSETTPLRPVTWSNEKQRFVAAAYGIDGRLLEYNSWHPLSDERNANNTTMDGYYIKATFYARCGQNVDVTLSPAVEVNEGIDGTGTYILGVPVWNPRYEPVEKETTEGETVGETTAGETEEPEMVMVSGHDNGGQGAENAIRLGFRMTYVDSTGTPVEEPREEGQFFIFEPNCDLHADGSTGYYPTPSIDGTETLIEEAYLIRQTASTWTEADPIEHGVVIKSLGELIEPPTLFSLRSGEIIRIELYVWLEGQDIDCTNQSSGAQIQANIQFTGSTESQSGMEIIQ